MQPTDKTKTAVSPFQLKVERSYFFIFTEKKNPALPITHVLDFSTQDSQQRLLLNQPSP